MKRWWMMVMMAGLAMPGFSQEQVVVNSDRVNLRSRPDLQSEHVGTVNQGDILQVIARHGDWIEVVPPTETTFWVHRDFLEQGRVTTKKLNVRSGPSINHSIVGQLNKGDLVVERSTFTEWVEIEPPPSASVYVYAELVDSPRSVPPLPLPPMAEPLEGQPGPEPAGAPLVGSTTALQPFPPPEPFSPDRIGGEGAPPDLKLIPLAGQGRLVQHQGEIKRTPWLMRNGTSPYRLIRRDGNQITTLCFIRGNTRQLESLLDQVMIVHGRAYYVEGADYPVVVVEKFEKRNAL
ncbi:MAG: SH3 domain-containing protein [Verrucomicrobia bacterium]|nr:SH3 domain-containing protein [Kiritimatiellia bacterium]MCP5488289.1 SH3 domain-containing protein [Verrucomicrobiota bacterium]